MTKKDRIPTIQSLYEDDSQFGDDIAKINDWFSKEYDESYQFEWDGKTLKIMDGDEKEVETKSKEDLSKLIDGFGGKVEEAAGTPNHTSVKELNDDIDNYLTSVYDKAGDVQEVITAGNAIIDNVKKMLEGVK